MKYMKPIVLALAALLAAPIPLASANSFYEEPVIKNIYNEIGQIVGQTRGANPVAESEYKVSRHSHLTDSFEVYYPQMDSPNIITSVLVNYQLIQAPGRYMSNAAAASKISLDYTVTRQDANVLSVVFRGEQTQENSTHPLLTSVNYNPEKRLIITAKNLVEDTDRAREAVTRLLRQAAKNSPATIEPPVFGDMQGVYLTGKYVVFYYQPGDNAAKFVELPIAIGLINPYLSSDYRTLTVTREVQKDPSQVIADIDNSLASYKSVSGKRGAGDSAADFTAYFDKDQLVYAEEKQNTGDYDTSLAKYYFNEGKLVAYKKSDQSLIVPPGGVTSVQREEISLFYDAPLNLTDGELKINGVATKLPDSYIKEAYTAAKDIRGRAADLWMAMKKENQ